MNLIICLLIIIAEFVLVTWATRSRDPHPSEEPGYRFGQVITNIDLALWEKVKEIPRDKLYFELPSSLIKGPKKSLNPYLLAKDQNLRAKLSIEFQPGHRVSLAEIENNPDAWPDNTGFVVEGTQYRGGVAIEGAEAIYRSGSAIWLIHEKEVHIGTPRRRSILRTWKQVQKRAFVELGNHHDFATAQALIQAAALEQGIRFALLVVQDDAGEPVDVSTKDKWTSHLDETRKALEAVGLPPQGAQFTDVWGLDGSKYQVGGT